MFRIKFTPVIFLGVTSSMRTKNKKLKVCFAASSGGHLEQLLMLKPLMMEYDSFILTEKTRYEASFPVETLFVPQVNRSELSFVLHMVENVFSSISIWIRKRPDVVVCTGVLATVPFCLISKVMGAKLVYIESFAKTDSPTVTGKFLEKRADRFYVQWPSMLDVYPNALCVGGVY